MSDESTIDPVVPTDETVAPDAIPESSPEVVVQADAPEEPKKTPWFQKRIDEVTAARREAERETQRLTARIQELEQSQTAKDEPKLEDFPDWETFQDARTQ